MLLSKNLNNPSLEKMQSETSSLSNYEIQRVLGQGSSGTVYLALDKKFQRQVALKEVKIKDQMNSKAYKDVINEVEVMKKIKHPNIIKLYDSFIDS